MRIQEGKMWVPERPKGVFRNLKSKEESLVERVSDQLEKKREEEEFERKKGEKREGDVVFWNDPEAMKKNEEYLKKMVKDRNRSVH